MRIYRLAVSKRRRHDAHHSSCGERCSERLRVEPTVLIDVDRPEVLDGDDTDPHLDGPLQTDGDSGASFMLAGNATRYFVLQRIEMQLPGMDTAFLHSFVFQ